jgi:acyl-CoA dehydrogenase-like protein
MQKAAASGQEARTREGMMPEPELAIGAAARQPRRTSDATALAYPMRALSVSIHHKEALMNGTTMTILSEELISRCGSRAAGYDRENRFFTEDFEELRAAGYLKLAVPEHLGGRGMSLAEICREQRRLAYRAPATALATNMHVYWTGVAADMRKAGDSSLEWILEEAAAGEVFAAGHGEAGNDLPLFLSTAKGRACRRRLPVLGSQDLLEPHARVDAPRDSRDGRDRPARAADHPRLPAA